MRTDQRLSVQKNEGRERIGQTSRSSNGNGASPKRKSYLASVTLLVTALFLLPGTGRAATVTVQVAPGGDLSFSPDSVSIQPGDTVQWVWANAGMDHSVTSGTNGASNGLFDSGLHKSSTFTFSFTFPNAGTFAYFCTPHFEFGMTGTVTVAETAPPSPLVNISTRLGVLTGDNVLIGGFIIGGTDNKKVVLRAIGPSLSNPPFNLTGVLADPTIELHDGTGAIIATNDNWKDTQQTDIAATGLAPTNDLESAILRSLPPGNYTAIVRGKDNGTGTGLVEAYDVDLSANAKLSNISTRGFVDINDNVMIGGFIVGTGGSAKVLVRAIGPSLSNPPFNLTGVLADPTVSLFDAHGTMVASNDNWKNTQQADIQATGLAPTDDHESAILATLPSGSYTIIVRGANNTTGVGLVEVFNIQ
jgi:plastocyanin